MEATTDEVNVLVVDDYRDSLVAMRAALDGLGGNIVECGTGEDALRQLLKRDFAVIILDVRLPGMDGFDIAAIIRGRQSCSDTPIIFLTGMSKDRPEVARGYSLGAVDYLIKPVDPEILRAKVRVFIDLHRKTEQVRRQTEQIYQLREREAEQARERERLASEHEALLREKKAAEALAQKAAELERSNSELRQFAYIASHDLQEPLRTIANFSELLFTEYRGKLSPSADDYLRFITDGARRMTSLIRGLLEHSRIGQVASQEEVDCAEIVQQVVGDLAAGITESKSDIRVGPLPSVRGNPSEIRLLFQNLIANAVKFRSRGRAPQIDVSGERRKDHIRFTIRDNGIGIDEKHRRRIFDLFQRGNAQGSYEGTGIGLAHCRKIVELYGGRIWVDSQVGEGSAFHFTFPC